MTPEISQEEIARAICARKVKRTRSDAEKVARLKRPIIRLFVYHCPVCGFYHHTKQRQ